MDDDLVEELNLPKNKYYADEIDIYDDKYYYNETHWWIFDSKYNKYFVEDYTSYGTTLIDISWYWKKVFNIDFDHDNWHTWLIPQNPLIIASAKANDMTSEEYTTLMIDYITNPRTIYNYTTYMGSRQENFSDMIAGLHNPVETGNGPVHIRRYTTYTEHHNYKYCKDCKTEFEVEAASDEILDNQISGTIMGYTREYR